MQFFKLFIKRGIILAFLFTPFTVQAQGQEDDSPIGYGSYDEALAALKELPDTTINQHNGWTVVGQKLEHSEVIWSFTPEDHLTHPATIRREFIKEAEKLKIEMTALCQANEEACDQLILQFKLMDEEITQSTAQPVE